MYCARTETNVRPPIFFWGTQNGTHQQTTTEQNNKNNMTTYSISKCVLGDIYVQEGMPPRKNVYGPLEKGVTFVDYNFDSASTIVGEQVRLVVHYGQHEIVHKSQVNAMAEGRIHNVVVKVQKTRGLTTTAIAEDGTTYAWTTDTYKNTQTLTKGLDRLIGEEVEVCALKFSIEINQGNFVFQYNESGEIQDDLSRLLAVPTGLRGDLIDPNTSGSEVDFDEELEYISDSGEGKALKNKKRKRPSPAPRRLSAPAEDGYVSLSDSE